MFDCGEGTQRQMMRYGVSFALEDIFFTHMHADHLLGVIGLIRTMALQGRAEPLRLWGPQGDVAHAESRRVARIRAGDVSREDRRGRGGAANPTRRLRHHRIPRRSPRIGVVRLRDRGRGPEGPIQSRSRARAGNSRRSAVGTDPSRAKPSRSTTAASSSRRCSSDRKRSGTTRRHHRRHSSVRRDDRSVTRRGSSRSRSDVWRRGSASARSKRGTQRRARPRRSRPAPVRVACSSPTSPPATLATRPTSSAKRSSVFPNTLIGKDGMEIEVPFSSHSGALRITAT